MLFHVPHHSSSQAGLVGGGTIPQPGEISLAHNGVLLLDELPEFPRVILELQLKPLEERRLTVSVAPAIRHQCTPEFALCPWSISNCCWKAAGRTLIRHAGNGWNENTIAGRGRNLQFSPEKLLIHRLIGSACKE